VTAGYLEAGRLLIESGSMDEGIEALHKALGRAVRLGHRAAALRARRQLRWAHLARRTGEG
jgi:hypothetical protein